MQVCEVWIVDTNFQKKKNGTQPHKKLLAEVKAVDPKNFA